MGLKHSRCLKEKLGHEFVRSTSLKCKKPSSSPVVKSKDAKSGGSLAPGTGATTAANHINRTVNVLIQKSEKPSFQRFPNLFDNEDQSDVTFLVGVDGWRFPGHKSVLVRASPVFKAMLDGPLSSSGKTKEEIPIEDVEPRAFENILRFIYIGDVKLLTIQATLDTLYAADKYMIPELMRLCLEVLDFSLSVTNVLVVHHAIRLYCSMWPTSSEQNDIEENQHIPVLHALQNRCLEIIDNYAEQVLTCDDFENLSATEVSEIVFRDTLQVNREGTVFQALHRWATQQCKKNQKEMTPYNKRDSLTNALYGVRYLLMNKEEFVNGPGSTDILTADEKAWLLAIIDGSEQPPPFSPEELVHRKRYLERRRGCESLMAGRSLAHHSQVATLTPPSWTDCFGDPMKKKKKKKGSCKMSRVFLECFLCFSLFFD